MFLCAYFLFLLIFWSAFHLLVFVWIDRLFLNCVDDSCVCDMFYVECFCDFIIEENDDQVRDKEIADQTHVSVGVSYRFDDQIRGVHFH